MTEPTELKSLLEQWRDHYVAMVKGGADPYEAADAMLTFSGMMIEKIRGAPFASMAMTAGAEFMRTRKQRPEEPTDGGALH